MDDDLIAKLISIGVHGYIRHDSATKHFIQAIYTIIYRSEIWAERKILTKALGLQTSFVSNIIKRTLKTHKMTIREREIVNLVIQGYRNKQIAKKLDITEDTVKSHLVHVFKKLEINNRTQLYTDINSYKT